MIQFNLLPDVKIAYIKARRIKRIVVLSSVVLSSASLGLMVILVLVVSVWGKSTASQLDKDVKDQVKAIKAIPNIDKILTIQNQLKSLPALHEAKPVTSRLFGYITQVTPALTTISKFNINYTESSVSITGAADRLETINRFVDTLKFTTYSVKDSTDTPKAFSKVVLESFGRDSKSATYSISLKFDPLIFDSKAQDIKLVVPKIITTRSETERPGVLFQPSVDPKPATGVKQ